MKPESGLATILSDQRKPELFDTPQAAAYLDLQPGTLEVWRCTRRYELPYIKVGRKVRYTRQALDTFLAVRTEGAAA